MPAIGKNADALQSFPRMKKLFVMRAVKIKPVNLVPALLFRENVPAKSTSNTHL